MANLKIILNLLGEFEFLSLSISVKLTVII